jgi:hypothetical protein
MRRCGALIGALAAALLLPGIASAHHRPGHTGGGGGTPTLTVGASPSPVFFGQSTVVSGRLTGTPTNGGRSIQRQSDPFPYGLFIPGPTVLTASNGNYAFASVQPRVNTLFRVQGAGLTSRVILVGVRLRVSFLVSDATPARGQRVVFSGTARPKHNGRLVRIQRRDSAGVFRTTATTVTRDVAGASYSRYSKALRVYRAAVYRVVVSSGDPDHWSGVSRTRFLSASGTPTGTVQF